MAANFFKVNKGLTLAPQPSEPSGQNGDLYYNTTLNRFRQYQNGSWKDLGSGSGGGGFKNYLSPIVTTQSSTPNPGNGDFELGSTAGWSCGQIGTLVNGLPTSLTPTFGADNATGTSNLTLSAVNTNIIAGTYSMSAAFSGVTVQGDMIHTNAFNIDNEDQAKVLGWKVFYKAQSGASNANWSGTSSNSFGVAFWDVTNSAWLSNTGNFSFTQSSGIGMASGSFQTAINTTQIRMVIYNVNATSGAITLYLDDASVGP